MEYGVWRIDYTFAACSVERETRRQGRLLCWRSTQLELRDARQSGREWHPHLLPALTRFVWAGSVWQMQRRGQCPAATKQVLFGVPAYLPLPN